MLILEKNENSIDIEVNTIFYIGDKKIKVVKSTPCDDCDCTDGCNNNCCYDCDDCFFHGKKWCINFDCTVSDRKDNTDVVFLALNE